MSNEPGLRIRVLVVEDEPLVGMIIEDAIEELGWETVGPVAALSEALALAETALFDCAVLDVNVRGGHTYPVATMLAERGLPVLMATGYGETTLPDRLRNEGRLSKPYTPEQLRHQLQLLCQRIVSRAV